MAQIKERYANALFNISEETDALEEDLEQATMVRDALDNKDIQAFLIHPHISDSAKRQFFHNAFSDKLSKSMMGFLSLMVRKSRESLIVPALTAYIERVNRQLGRMEAKIVSAKALTNEQIESIRTLLSKQIDMQVEVSATVDPDVLGGFYILVDGRIFDGTVRAQLNNMKKRFYRGDIEAKVVSAKALTEGQIESISAILSKKVDMHVKVKNIVDPDVIGGFYILVDGHAFDGTLRSELDIMKKRIKKGNYEC